MNVSVGGRWEKFVDDAVKTGRYASASEVVREGLRLVEERESKLRGLQEMLAASIANGGGHDDEEVADSINKRLKDLPLSGGDRNDLS